MSRRADIVVVNITNVVGGFNIGIVIFTVIVSVIVFVDEMLGPLNLSEGPLDLPDVFEFLAVAGESRAISRCMPFLLVIEFDGADGTHPKCAITEVF